MKLLLDENLSRKLVTRLAELYPESIHVAEVGLLASADREVWEYAKARGFIIVGADSDFYELGATIGPPPKVVWLRRWTHGGAPARGDPDHAIRRRSGAGSSGTGP